MFQILLLLITLNIGLDKVSAQTDCLQPYCNCLNRTTLTCHNFTAFQQLDFRRVNGWLFEMVELRPLNVKIDLNENLNFNGLRLNGRLTLHNIRSFTAFYNPFRQILYNKFNLAILDSNFKFVGGSTGNVQQENVLLNECDFQTQAENFNFVFSNLKIIEFTLSNILFERTMCPFLFKNTAISNLIINEPLGAFGFDTIKITSPSINIFTLLNTNIAQISFDYGKSPTQVQPQWLDAQTMLNQFMFAQLNRINLVSAPQLAYIQEDTFVTLKSVRKFEINNVRLKSLLTRNRRWLRNLNFNGLTYDMDKLQIDLALEQSVFQLLIWVNDDWSFNEESDICLFRNFPHNKLVFPFLLFSKTSLPCTCTVYWLYRYFAKYQSVYNLNQNIVPLHCFQQSNWDKCQFEALFNKYCPSSEDPDEAFTTLKPSTNFVQSTTSFTTLQTQTRTETVPTTITQTTRTTQTTQTSSYSAAPIQQVVGESNYAVVAFYLSIALCIEAAFIIAALIVLYCKVYKDGRVLKESGSKDTLNEIHLDTQEDTYI